MRSKGGVWFVYKLYMYMLYNDCLVLGIAVRCTLYMYVYILYIQCIIGVEYFTVDLSFSLLLYLLLLCKSVSLS